MEVTWLEDLVRQATDFFINNFVLNAVVVILVLVFLFSTRRGKNGKLPPGPFGLPLVGYVPFLTGNLHFDFVKLGKKYGDVFSLKLGMETVIVLNGMNVIKEAFSKAEFLGRPPHSFFSWITKHSPFFALGVPVWREQRRFFLHTMRDLGLGKSSVENEIESEIRHFLDVLRSHKGSPIDPIEPLSPSMSNNICALVFGKRYEYGHPDRQMLDSGLEDLVASNSQAAMPTFYPWIRHVPFIKKILGLGKAMAAGERICSFFRHEIEKRMKTFDTNVVRDFIDGYLHQMEDKKDDPTSSFNIDILVDTVLDLFAAGSETVRTTIQWCIYITAAYPEVQKRVQKELNDVLGRDRRPEFQDLRRLPYTNAVILEVMRWRTVVPINIMRYTVADTSVGGYHIPKNQIVMANFWAVHNDPSLWKDPETFKPERFLSADGKSVVKSGNLIPFSVGKRSCPGEAMANMEVFLYFSHILNEFEIAFPDGYKPTFDATLTATYKLNPYKVKFNERKWE
ncbi:hypothetical protein JTE90_017673 [Oedothorax gibbosus]|uniref:Cytochrome P450 n=1 Tax=Oedothorax gibbosus TaxID=931172 RepID=A0AAV6UF25_9ARAC|nr:hypothetical protein JTE90_017673 [Oedothorax gibbosus]